MLGFGVAGTMEGQDRRYRSGRREVGRAGQPGGGFLPITWNVSVNERTYKEGGGTDRIIRGKFCQIQYLQFQETNVTNGVYTHASEGCRVLKDNAPSRHRGGGVAVFFYLDALPQFQVEAYQPHGTNVVILQAASGRQRWYIV